MVMLVLKFGGSSLADAERILAAALIVAQRQAQTPVTVVVSAMAGVTDALLRIADGALTGQSGWRDDLAALEERHIQTMRELAGYIPDVFALRWQALSADANALAQHRAAGEDAATEAARFSGWGERLAVDLMAQALLSLGVVAAGFADEPVLLAEIEGQRASQLAHVATPSILATRAVLTPRLALLIMRGGIPVLPGYIARDASGQATTLGRNGSDHSAAVIAAALGATGLYLYSDVAGLYTADPRIVPDAELIPTLTYAEAGEIAALGAKALHPRTVEPTAHWGIPLLLRSSLAPDAPGTDVIPQEDVAAGLAPMRPQRWVVAAQALIERPPHLEDEQWRSGLVEVTATRLPAWPLTADEMDATASVAEAVAGELASHLAPLALSVELRQLRMIVASDRAAEAQRLAHTLLLQLTAPQAIVAAPVYESELAG